MRFLETTTCDECLNPFAVTENVTKTVYQYTKYVEVVLEDTSAKFMKYMEHYSRYILQGHDSARSTRRCMTAVGDISACC